MRRMCVAALATTFAVMGVAYSGGEEEARAIVAKAIKAAGGAEALKKHNAATWSEKGTYYGMGDGLPYTSKLAVQVPSQFRMEVEGVFTIIVNGDKGWMKMGDETKEMTKEQMASHQSNSKAGYINTLLPLSDKAFKLTVIDGLKVNEKPTLGLKVTRPDYPEVKLYFDKESHLLVKSQFKTFSNEQKKEVIQDFYFGKHKEMDGAKIPTHVVLKHDGKLFVESSVTSYKAEGKLDAKVFTP